MHGSDRRAAPGTTDRYADLALMIANAEENWAAPDEAEPLCLRCPIQCIEDQADREHLAFLSAIGPSDLGLMFMPPVFLLR